MLAMSIYAAGYAFELAAADLNTALFFSDIQYFGIPFVAFLLYSLYLEIFAAYQYHAGDDGDSHADSTRFLNLFFSPDMQQA